MPSTPETAASRPRSFAHLLGFTYVRADANEAVVDVMPQPEHCNERGIVHGGFLAALLDTTTGLAIHHVLPDGTAAPHFQLTVQYLNAAVPGITLTCVGRATKSGRRAAATDAEILQDGRVVARAIASHVVL
jgi:acyl-CoA thioesterase